MASGGMDTTRVRVDPKVRTKENDHLGLQAETRLSPTGECGKNV
jgi:hypothetical protein